MQVIDNLGVVGGAQRMAVDLTLSLNVHRFDPCFVSFFPPSGTVLEQMLADNSVRTYYLGKRLGFDPRVFAALDRVLRKEQPSILHTHLGALRYVFPLTLLRRPPVVLHTVHILMKRWDFLSWVDRLAFWFGVTPVTIAKAVADSLGTRLAERRCTAISNGIRLERFARGALARDHWRAREGFPTDAVLFVNIARCDETKHQTLLIDAFSRVCPELERARLLFVGEGPLRAELEAYTASSGLGECVHFLGFREDITDILHAVDVFVLCSRSEAQPLSVMEAMAAGRPVIASRVGGVAELVVDGRSGILFESGDLDALARAIRRLALQPALAASMGREAAAKAKREFGLTTMVRTYEALYSRLLAAAPGR